jgi:hypothetical protein
MGGLFVHLLRALAAFVLAASAALGAGHRPAAALDSGAVDLTVTVTAFLDGKPLAIRLVANYYCDDLAFPVIQCSTQPATIAARASLYLLSGVDYVTIYDQAGFNGPYMNLSQDYATLLTIGWNDRISSFRAKNSETGRFTVDWLFSGSSWPFCCNSQLSTLGGYDNSFSSVERT